MTILHLLKSPSLTVHQVLAHLCITVPKGWANATHSDVLYVDQQTPICQIQSFPLIHMTILLPFYVGTSGDAEGTYYYDVKLSECPGGSSVQDVAAGIPTCASYTPGPDQVSLQQLGSNNVIAIGQLFQASDDARSQFCGKQVLVTVDGNQIGAPDGGDFYVWDGCEECSTSDRIDFSVSGLLAVNSDACSLGVVPGVHYEITDTQVRDFVA